MKNEYKFDKKLKSEESLKQTINGIVDNCIKRQYQILSITTSTLIKVDKQNFCNCFKQVLEERKIKGKYIDFEAETGFDIQIKPNCAEITIWNLPPVLYSANALECMKKSDGCILIERYTETSYMQFQDVVTLLKDNMVNPIGIVAYQR